MKSYNKKHQEIDSVSREDRRVLLHGSLKLLIARCRSGQPIFKDSLVRLVPLADLVIARTHRKRKPIRPPTQQLKLKFDRNGPNSN